MFRESLEEIAGRCRGLTGATLVGPDGLPIELLVVDGEQDLEMISAELVALAQAACDAQREFGGGHLRSVDLETEDHVLLMGEAVDGVFLLLIFKKAVAGAEDLARARFELRRSPLILGPVLLGDAYGDQQTGGGW